MIRWPWVSRRTHDAALAEQRAAVDAAVAERARLRTELTDLRASYLNTIADARGRSGLLRWLNAAWEENEIPAELRRVYLPARAAWAIASEAHRQRAESLKVNSPPYSQRHAFKAAQTATIPAADAIGLFELDGVRFFAVVVPDAAPISP